MPDLPKVSIKVSAILALLGTKIKGQVATNRSELAGLLGMDPSTLSRVLKGRSATEEMVQRMTSSTNLPRDYFVGEDLGPDPADALRVSKAAVISDWSDDVLAKAIQKSQHGDTLDFFSTFFPEQEERRLTKELKRLMKRLPQPETPENKLSVRILLLHFDCQAIMDTRTSLLVHPPEFQGTVKRQAQRFCDLRAEIGDKIALSVKFYRAWPFGHYFRIGSRHLQYSPLLALTPATDGFTIISSDPTSEVWEELNRNFSKIHDHAELAREAGGELARS
jgi:transcriptional regulator with XRE-family HTH domain